MGKFNKQLLVEGNDDFHVVASLCKKFSVEENFQIIDCNGIENLFSQIPIRLKQSEFEALGLIVDADVEIGQRWNSLHKIFSGLEIDLPDALPADGLVIKSKLVSIGIWIMPNNNINGMLEDFISFLVPKGDTLFPFAQQTLEVIEKENLNKYISVHKSKALIHSWLAWQEDPGTPMGLAITKKYLTTEEELCKRFITWLGNTFQ